ncbi:Glycogen synthase [Paracholeplasma brassicae]|uniref:Glycogen synthase n=1 Tax=Acholeplasma brassicae TaxID=61635 RepID=U4KP62_9MOLU|nr:glycogen/starch synthase [Paracholeplasma brassicae]CCV66130.1 Glycogen synthase [Paracholeplasma brassicae]
MNLLFCASEAVPFSKTGGLADVAGALPKQIVKLGHQVIVLTPMYESIYKNIDDFTHLGQKEVYIQNETYLANYYQTIVDGVTYVFIENDLLFKRKGYYGYYDDEKRFIFFSYAILEFVTLTNRVDLIHLNDWQTALIPYLLDELYRHKKGYEHLKTLLSIHNLEYQGSFNKDFYPMIGTPFSYAYIHFDRINFLKAGIMRADYINTVSQTYSNEIKTQYYGFTLDGALNSRASNFRGILNGIDYDIYNPETDAFIDYPFNQKNFITQKRKNKLELLKSLGLDQSSDIALVCYIGRLAKQKGVDLFMTTLEETICKSNANYIFIGSGDEIYENFLRDLSYKYPSKFYAYIGFNNSLAHQVYASSDILVMPSQFEPCGLSQMIAMRYATLPVVRETGGLKDTVIPYNKYTKEGNGFSFANYNAHELRDVLLSAISLHNNDKKSWRILQRHALNEDFSLNKMGIAYLELYQEIIK